MTVADYDPKNFDGFLTALEVNEHIWKEDAIEEWINHWLTEKRHETVFRALERADARGVELRNYDRMFELALSLYGRERAYPWLVKAHREQRGWLRYYSSEDKTYRRWRYVETLYPERWFDFVKQTLKKEESTEWQDLYLDSAVAARLIQYCVELNKPDVAKDAAECLVDGSLQLVAGLPLPEPEWKFEP